MLLPEQVEALRGLERACRELGADVVVIGAIAYRAWVANDYRSTEDVDAAVALDMDEFSRLTERLVADGWRQEPRLEHRWRSPEGARVDLLPVGSKTRHTKEIVWPRGETRMSVVGFEHVFRDAVRRELAPGLEVRIVPPPVLALLKIISYMDRPYIPQKDLGDLVSLMLRYEEDGDRRFGDVVLDGGVLFDDAGAYLLGRDLHALCAAEDAEDEVEVVERFLRHVTDPDFGMPLALARLAGIRDDDPDAAFARIAGALASGFHRPVDSRP